MFRLIRKSQLLFSSRTRSIDFDQSLRQTDFCTLSGALNIKMLQKAISEID